MEKIRVIDTQNLRFYFGDKALELIEAHTPHIQIDKWLGIDKKGRDIYEHDILRDKHKKEFMVGESFGGRKLSIQELKKTLIVDNAHARELEKLF